MESNFKNPPKAARPMVRWWWPGMDIKKEELLKEVAELDALGFYGAEIQCFCFGLPAAQIAMADPERHKRMHRFLTPYYYEMVEAVMGECEKRGMVIDLTICSSWPAGGVHVGKEDSLQMMLSGVLTLEGNTRYIGPVPAMLHPNLYGSYNTNFQQSLGLKDPVMNFTIEDMKLFRIVAAKSIGEPGKYTYEPHEPGLLDMHSLIDLTGLADGGHICWDVPEGQWQLFAFYCGSTGTSPIADAREDADKKSLVVNHLSSDAILKHIDYHFERGRKYLEKHFGKGFRAFFTDSLELICECFWTQDFLQQFKSRRGYELSPFLPIVFVPQKDNSYSAGLIIQDKPCFDFANGIGDRIRYDVQQTISDLFVEEFTSTMARWGEQNQLQSRIQAYGIRADTLRAYGLSHIPETETLYAGGIIDFLKLAGSAGVIYQKPIITAEALSWNRRDFMTTPMKIKVAADRLFVSGINQMIFHGFPYQYEDFTYPGYRPFSTEVLHINLNFSSCFGRTNPFYDYLPEITAYISRCQYLLQKGKTICHVAVYYPLFGYPYLPAAQEEMVEGRLDEDDAELPEDTQSEYRRACAEPPAGADDLRMLQRQVKLGHNLMENGYYYVHINEDRILNCEVENGRLHAGDAEIEVLILNSVKKITLNLARRLSELARRGVKILFLDDLPESQPGYFNYESNDAEITEIANKLGDSEHLARLDENPAQHIRDVLAVQPDVLCDDALDRVHFIHKRTEDSDIYFIRQGRNYPRSFDLKFPRVSGVPFMLDPWTGQENEAAQYNCCGDSIAMNIRLEGYGSTFIEFKQVQAARHIEEDIALPDKTEIPVHGCDGLPPPIYIDKWSLASTFRDNNGNMDERTVSLDCLKDWRDIPALRYNSGRGSYTARFSLGEEYNGAETAIIIDLGSVHDTAELRINGVDVGKMLMYPYRMDVSRYVACGENTVEITLTTTLRNRLIGYGESGDERYRNYKGRELMPAGLVGPVQIVAERKISI
jgi:hypothetical protein